ncbi:MAG: peroxidase family protein [Geminicoccaceae bacterium]
MLELGGEPYDGSHARSIDGSGNNAENPDMGATGTMSMRMMPDSYADSDGSPAGTTRPGAREISNAVVRQERLSGNSADASNMFWQWGQFIDHDLTLNHATGDAMDIAIPAGDIMYDPAAAGDQWLPFLRSDFAMDADGKLQQVNSITAFLDGSMVYGSTEESAADLRAFEGGRLRTGDNDLLPKATNGQFLAGDVRAGEQPGLSAMHTVFMREHNRIAGDLARKNPQWSDEQLYQAAREKVIAEIQSITYNEFLPILLGPDALPDYSGYDPSVDPRISASFATAAFRFGHSMVSPDIARLDENGQQLAGGSLSIENGFFNPAHVTRDGIDPYLRGLASGEAQELDAQIVDPLRNMLFGAPGAGALDLAALNIQRGRDHGLPSSNDAREALGLARIESFDDPALRDGAGARLASVYETIEDVDLWVGGLSEKPAGGGLVGDTFRAILVDQFTRTRDGDRFWYENLYSGSALRELQRTTLADIIERNTGVRDLQDEVMKVA